MKALYGIPNAKPYSGSISFKKKCTHVAQHTQSWSFQEHFSAAGRVDADTLVLASETALWRFDITTGDKAKPCLLDAENPITRSNDGRADPWGGFWIGTMGKAAEPEAGAIYRYYKGNLRRMIAPVSISNAICFAPDRSCAYYTDTATQKIMRQRLEAETGWPEGGAEILVDLQEKRLNPDGAVTDANGNLWVAMWGASAVVCLSPEGQELRRVEVPARQPSCPAFGGPDLRDLYVTSATVGVYEEELKRRPTNGATFVLNDIAQGLPEPKVFL